MRAPFKVLLLLPVLACAAAIVLSLLKPPGEAEAEARRRVHRLVADVAPPAALGAKVDCSGERTPPDALRCKLRFPDPLLRGELRAENGPPRQVAIIVERLAPEGQVGGDVPPELMRPIAAEVARRAGGAALQGRVAAACDELDAARCARGAKLAVGALELACAPGRRELTVTLP